ncbi:uncharacterized protein LOC142526885 [Primulina tabacum]|uniref:uncharacterized protein LOC142526885 n=1 Tax=Primulina tabacum TaxID=48773 RepID=UPI003F5A3774
MEKGNRERRSPLQDLNVTIPINTKKCLNLSSSRIKRPDSGKSARNTPNDSAVASKAALPRKSILQKSKKNQPPRLTELGSGRKCAKPVSKSGQRSRLSAVEVNSGHNLKKKSKDFQTKMKNSQETCSEFDDKTNGLLEDSFSRTVDHLGAPTVKTPPVEASVSPDIQCPSDLKNIVSQSTELPVCYGAGHLLSGVTDKRKCRRRGSLRGCEKLNLFQGEWNEANYLHDSLIPPLAEGSVTWHDDQGNYSRISLDQSTIRNDNASAALDLSSSPSALCGNATDSVWDDVMSCSVSVSIGNLVNVKKTGIVTHSPAQFLEFSGPWNNEVDESLLAASPISSSCGKAITEDDSEFFMNSLSSGNVIQTPNSGSGSELCVGRSNVEVDQRNFFQSKNDSISKVISQENVDFDSSWISDSTIENLALSRTRISWRDEIYGSRDLEVDEFDCCRVSSDEEIDGDQIYDQQLTTSPRSKLVDDKENDLQANSDIEGSYSGIASGTNEGTIIGNDGDLSPPVVLEYEPSVSARGKEKLAPPRTNTCAESICTSGGGQLLTSSDSDWSYFPDITCLRSNSYK